MTWAAGLAGVTSHAMLVATAHVPAIHPVLAAKAAATIDHISGGRFAFNIVAGWYKDELELFGSKLLDHEGRYSQAAEWMDFVKQLWSSDDEFDFAGDFYNAEAAVARPKPVQTQPLIINAASSDRGMEFAAAHADVVFTGAPPPTLKRSLTTADMRQKTGKADFEYEIACSQLCGLGHFRMRGFVTVQSAADYDKWLADQAKELKAGN